MLAMDAALGMSNPKRMATKNAMNMPSCETVQNHVAWIGDKRAKVHHGTHAYENNQGRSSDKRILACYHQQLYKLTEVSPLFLMYFCPTW